jgi:hypothetical protein
MLSSSTDLLLAHAQPASTGSMLQHYAQYRTPYAHRVGPSPFPACSCLRASTSTRLPPMLMTPLFHPPLDIMPHIQLRRRISASSSHLPSSALLTPTSNALLYTELPTYLTFELVLTLTHSLLLTPWLRLLSFPVILTHCLLVATTRRSLPSIFLPPVLFQQRQA